MVYYVASSETGCFADATRKQHRERRYEMFMDEKAKVFKVGKALKKKWDAMTDIGDFAGIILGKVTFIRKGLEKIKSPLLTDAKRLEGMAQCVVDVREIEGGLSGNLDVMDRAYLRMACALVAEEAGEKAAEAIFRA